MMGLWQVRNAVLKPLYEEAKQLCEELEVKSFMHIMKQQKARADALAQEALKIEVSVMLLDAGLEEL